ncbi:MAG: alcohol dehydrogenase catalytic domain-containing protein [Candidatus Nitrosopolaris sp.]
MPHLQSHRALLDNLHNLSLVCRRGDFITCSYAQVPGISYDGGYADYMIAPIEALASIPDELSATEAAPLMCFQRMEGYDY